MKLQTGKLYGGSQFFPPTSLAMKVVGDRVMELAADVMSLKLFLRTFLQRPIIPSTGGVPRGLGCLLQRSMFLGVDSQDAGLGNTILFIACTHTFVCSPLKAHSLRRKARQAEAVQDRICVVVRPGASSSSKTLRRCAGYLMIDSRMHCREMCIKRPTIDPLKISPLLTALSPGMSIHCLDYT